MIAGYSMNKWSFDPKIVMVQPITEQGVEKYQFRAEIIERLFLNQCLGGPSHRCRSTESICSDYASGTQGRFPFDQSV